MSFEGYRPEAADNFYNNHVGDALIFQVEGPMEANEKMSVTDLLDRNEETIKQTAMNMVEHFSKILGKLPEHMQKELIDSLPTPGRHDVVYAGMIDSYNKA